MPMLSYAGLWPQCAHGVLLAADGHARKPGGEMHSKTLIKSAILILGASLVASGAWAQAGLGNLAGMVVDIDGRVADFDVVHPVPGSVPCYLCAYPYITYLAVWGTSGWIRRSQRARAPRDRSVRPNAARKPHVWSSNDAKGPSHSRISATDT